MNDFGKQIGDIFGTVGTVLILLLPLTLIFFIVRNAIALKRELKETKELEAARAEAQRRAVLQRQTDLEQLESDAQIDLCEEEDQPHEDTESEDEESR